MVHDGAQRPRITWDDARLIDIAQLWKVTRLELFGSVLRDDFRADSDVDVLVTFAPDARVTPLSIVRFEDELAALFGRRVDITTRPSVEKSPNYIRRREILRSPLTIYDTRSGVLAGHADRCPRDPRVVRRA